MDFTEFTIIHKPTCEVRTIKCPALDQALQMVEINEPDWLFNDLIIKSAVKVENKEDPVCLR